jgi:hypothetical protein
MGMFPKTVIPGGTAVTYAPNTIFVITKSQDKASSGELNGWNFTLNVHKSRLVREKAKFIFNVQYEDGINRWSGLLELALEAGIITKPKQGWYARVDQATGELGKNHRLADIESNEDFWKSIFDETNFSDWIQKRYSIGLVDMVSNDGEMLQDG